MKLDVRVVFAALVLVLGSCSGSGLDSGMGGLTPPVSQPGPMNQGGAMGANINGNNNVNGPTIGMNGQEELANPGATMAPNEAQYAVSQGPSGMKCPTVTLYAQQFTCNVAFNMPSPSPTPSGAPKATATASPTPSPTPSSDDDNSDDSDDSASPTPSPGGGTVTMLVEPLPKDAPAMTNPNPAFMRITPLMAIRLQSSMAFNLNGLAQIQYTLPVQQFAGRVFSLQLFSETTLRGKRIDQIVGNYAKWTSPNTNQVQFNFTVPNIMVRQNQVWLLAMYGAQLPPNSTPTPSPSPAASASPAASP